MNKRFTLRVLIALVLWITFLIQVHFGFIEYLRRETVQVSTTERRKNFFFPSFTFCPIIDKSGGIEKSLKDAYEEVKEKPSVLYAIRQTFRHNPGFINYDYIRNVTGPNYLHKYITSKPVTFTQLANCFTYDPPYRSEAGMDNAVLFLFNMTGLSRVKVIIHNRGMYLSSSINFHGSYSFQLAPLALIPKANKHNNPDYMNITIKRYNLQTSHRQHLITEECISDYNERVQYGSVQELEDCYMNYISSEMNCDMPWTNKTELQYSNICATKNKYQELIDIYNAFDGYSSSQLQNVTSCYPPCGLQSHHAINYANHWTSIPKPDNHSVILGMMAEYKTSSYVMTREVLHYGFKDLIADFGGYLGLLLGFSALDLFDILVGIFGKIKTAYNNKKEAVKDQQDQQAQKEAKSLEVLPCSFRMKWPFRCCGRRSKTRIKDLRQPLNKESVYKTTGQGSV